jgi:hypothetical protein
MTQRMKAFIREILVIRQRSLTVSASEKEKLVKDLSALISKTDAMPDKMNCPMMDMKTDHSSNKDAPAKDAGKPEEHKH